MPSDESVGLAGPATVGASTLRKVVTGATIGNAVEWFDFAIYGFLATYIAANFFPSGDETAAPPGCATAAFPSDTTSPSRRSAARYRMW